MKKPKQHHKSEAELRMEIEIKKKQAEAQKEHDKKKAIVKGFLAKLDEESVQNILVFTDALSQAIGGAFQKLAIEKTVGDLGIKQYINKESEKASVYEWALDYFQGESISSALQLLNTAKGEVDLQINDFLTKKGLKELEVPEETLKDSNAAN